MNKAQLTMIVTVAVILSAVFALVLMTAAKQKVEEEALKDHRHIRLLVFDNGQNVTIPAHIGITGDLWHNRTLDVYGIGGVSPIHTHQDDGVIHIEATEVRNWTLGDFIAIWGSDFPTGSIVFTDNAGEPHTLANIPDYHRHELKDLETLTVYYPEYAGPVLP